MGILGWIGAGCLIGAAVGVAIMTGGAAAPAVAGAVKAGAALVAAEAVVAGAAVGAAVGAGAGAVVGVAAEVAEPVVRAVAEAAVGAAEAVAEAAVGAAEAVARAVTEGHHRPVNHLRRKLTDLEKKKREEEEKAQRRRKKKERVSSQVFVVFGVLCCNNRDQETQSHSGQNAEKTQGTGTQTHHRSTNKQDCEDETEVGGGSPGGGDPPGGGGGRRDREDGDCDQEGSDSEEKSDSEEESQQTGEQKKRKSHQKKSKRQNRGGRATVLTANLWSLNNKELRVLRLIEENQVDVACLTETFLDQNIADGLLSRASGPNFNYQFRNRQGPVGLRRPKRSGGVAIVFSTDLLGEPCHLGSTTTFEYDARLVQHGHWMQPIVFICLYRRPGQTRRVLDPFLKELERFLNQRRLANQSIIVTGDFNIWVDQETRASNMFQSFLTRNHLRQHVNQPTHRSGHTLDLVLTRNVQISDVSVGNNLIRDHYPVFFKARPGQSSEEEEEEEDKRRKNNNSPG